MSTLNSTIRNTVELRENVSSKLIGPKKLSCPHCKQIQLYSSYPRLHPITKYQMPENLILETTQGSIQLKLFDDIAPKTCENFRTHAKNGYYDGIIFHRIIEAFMIQGGDPTGTGRGGKSIWGKPFEDECDESQTFNRPGLLAMANAGPNTNGSQFFITTVETPWLNMNHTIFGEVVDGMDVVTKLEKVEKSPDDRPIEDQKIISIKAAE